MANESETLAEVAPGVARGPRTRSGRFPAVWPAQWARDGAEHAPVLDTAAANAIFELLVAVMWSDGELAATEVARGRAAVEVMGLRPARGGAFTAMADGALPFGEIDIDGLTGPQRRLAFAAAEWLADAAPSPSDRSNGFVRALQMRLGIDDDDARILGEIALGLGRECEDPRHAFGILMRSLLR